MSGQSSAENNVRAWRPSDGDSRCQECGRPYVPWFTDSALWNLVIGGPDTECDPGGYLCSLCFTMRAESVFPFVWRLVPEWTAPLARVIPPAETGVDS